MVSRERWHVGNSLLQYPVNWRIEMHSRTYSQGHLMLLVLPACQILLSGTSPKVSHFDHKPSMNIDDDGIGIRSGLSLPPSIPLQHVPVWFDYLDHVGKMLGGGVPPAAQRS
jgi:hypothetical protein